MDVTTHIIIYEGENDQQVLVYPSQFCGLTLEQIALKDVPAGKPFRFVAIDEIPQDFLVFQGAFEVDYTESDGVGADYGIGSYNAVVGYGENNTPILKEEDHIQ